MLLKKSMISVAAATLLAVGFTGCGKDSIAYVADKNGTGSSVNQIEQNAYLGTVTGAVIDDLGNPVEGASVTLNGQTQITDASGSYMFSKVNVSGYITTLNGSVGVVTAPTNRLMTVSVIVPNNAEYNNAFATVTPEMVHVENLGNNGAFPGVTTTGDTINTQPNSQSFTVNADVGLVMLSKKIAKVTGTVRNTITGEVIPEGTRIIATYGGVNVGVAPGIAAAANTTTGVNTVVGTIGANGVFTLGNLLTSSIYNFTVEGYFAENVTGAGATLAGTAVGINTTVSGSYADGGFVTNTGNVMVTPITATDVIPPFIIANNVNSEITPYVGVAHPTDVAEGMVIYAEGIDGTSGNEFIVSFTEAIDPAKVKADSIIVFDRTNSTELTGATWMLGANNKSILITTASAVAQGTVLEFRLRRSDFTDTSGNILNTVAGAFNQNLGATTSNNPLDEVQGALTGNQFAVLNASTYTVPAMGLVPPVVPTGAQNAGTNADLTVAGYSNPAFNTVSTYTSGVSTILNNMNAASAVNADLTLLATTLDSGLLAAVNQNATTITFTVDPNVTTYYARVLDSGNTPIATATITQVTGSDTGAGAPIIPTVATIPTNALVAAGTELKNGSTIVNTFLVDLGAPLNTGDKVEIYAVNDFGDSSLATTIPLVDNTPITTVINNNVAASALALAAGTAVDVVGAGAPAGATGNLLAQGTSGSGGGMPLLYIRADMLQARYNAADNDLRAELTGADDIYSASDFTGMAKARSVGVQVSEPITANLATSVKVLDTAGTDTNAVTATSTGTNAGKQVVALTVSDILAMQDYGSVTLAGVADAAGNIAGAQAGDKIYDAMPPLMTSATISDMSASFSFTEPVSLLQTNAAIASYLNMAGGVSTYTFATTATGGITVSRNTNYIDHNNDTSVTAGTSLETTVTNVDGNLTVTLTGNLATGVASTADLSNFFEDVHGVKNAAGSDNTIATGSSVVTFTNVPDTKTNAAGVLGTNNSWALSKDNIAIVPTFAAADAITPKVAPLAGAINPLAIAANQQQVDVRGPAGALQNNVGSVNADTNWEVGDATGAYSITIKFREPITAVAGSVADLFGTVNYDMIVATPGNTYQITTPKTVTVTGLDTLTFSFSKVAASIGAVQAGDALVITGVTDASGNTTNVTVTLGAALGGLSLNASSY